MIDKTPSIAELAEQIAAHEKRVEEDARKGVPPIKIVDYITQPTRDELHFDSKRYEELRSWAERTAQGHNFRLGDVPLFKSVEKGVKPGELMFFATGPGFSVFNRRSDFFTEMMKKREFRDKAEIVFMDIEYSPGAETQQFQRMSRIMRQPTRKASRRYREGSYIGTHEGKAYRSRIMMWGRPDVGIAQIEYEVWRRVAGYRKFNVMSTKRDEMETALFRLKETHRVFAAVRIIKEVGGVKRLQDIPEERIDAVLAECAAVAKLLGVANDTERKEETVHQGECCLQQHGQDSDVGRGVRQTGEGDSQG